MAKRLNRDDVDKFHDHGLYIPTRTIYVGSESFSEEVGESGTDGNMAQRLIKNLTVLNSISSDHITILLNNVGGDTYHGLAIYDAIKHSRSNVTVIVYGYAMSMGSIILQAADKRILMPSAKQMIHYGMSGISLIHTKTAQKWSDECKKMDKYVEKIYLERIREKHKGYALADLQKLLDHDTYLTAQESVRLGLADKVGGE